MPLGYSQVAAMQDTQTRNVCPLDTGTQDTALVIRSRKLRRLLDQRTLSAWYATETFPQSPGSHTHFMAKYKVCVCVNKRLHVKAVTGIHITYRPIRMN